MPEWMPEWMVTFCTVAGAVGTIMGSVATVLPSKWPFTKFLARWAPDVKNVCGRPDGDR